MRVDLELQSSTVCLEDFSETYVSEPLESRPVARWTASEARLSSLGASHCFASLDRLLELLLLLSRSQWLSFSSDRLMPTLAASHPLMQCAALLRER